MSGIETKELVNSQHEKNKMDPVEAIQLIRMTFLMLM